MAVSVDQFGKALVASGVMSADEVKPVWAELATSARPKDGAALARALVERGNLTDFQAQQILAGRGSTLVMGEYVVLAEIGAGGMGQVYKAQHRRMKRVVALKVMSSAAMKDEASVKRFQREVEAAAKLEHPNIVTAYDAGRAGNVAFLVMQFVDGGDLSSLVKKHGPLAVERAVDYVRQAACGLAYAHSEGVIHRDIKPANLLCDKKGVVKILDMGLARLEKGDDGLTATEQVMGTVDYMSPEQASNTKTADGRSDIYSLGCTFWYLLTGRRAYDGDTLIERLMAHREQPLPSLVQQRDDVPWPLEQVFHKMVAKRAAERFQSMDEVVAALEPFGGGTSRSGSGGMGSSLGMGPGPHDAELSAFLRTVGPGGGKSQTGPAASKTSSPIDATEQFVKPEVETDPKSAISLPPFPHKAVTGGRGPATKRAPSKGKQPPVKLIAAGVGALALLIALGVWVVVRDKNNEVVATVQVPAGGSVTVQPGAGPPPNVQPSVVPTTLRAAPGSLFTVAPPAAPVAPPPAGDYALLFDGNGIVQFDDPLNYSPYACTIEALVRVDAFVPRSTIYALSDRGSLVMEKGQIRLQQILDPNGWYHVSRDQPFEQGRRVHVAAVCDKQRLRIFVDGKLVGQTSSERQPSLTAGAKPPQLGSLFAGLIDEIRISSVARYVGGFTPPARHDPDADTLALYHCDEGFGKVLIDSSGNKRNGRIENVKWVKSDGSPIPAAPPGAYALRFDGRASRVELPEVGALITQPLTLEAWAYLRDEPSAEIHQFLIQGGGMHLSCDRDGRFWQFYGGQTGGAPPKLNSDQPAATGRWVHVAAVSDGTKRYLFVDGVRQKATAVNRPPRDLPKPMTLGASFPGMLREVRLSKVARYSADFVPAPRFTADAETLALYHCDDGAGDVVADSSGRNLHGRIVIAEWVTADGSPIPPAASVVTNAEPSFTAVLPAARWPLAPSKPEDIQRLLAAQATLTLRTGSRSETVVGSPDQIPAAPATVVGVLLSPELATVDDALLGVVAGLTDLEVFQLSNHGAGKFDLTSGGLRQLASLVQLRRLDVPKLASSEAADILRSMPHLTFVELPYGTADEWAPAVAAQPSITEIIAYRCKLTDDGLAHLAKMPQLQHADLKDNPFTPTAVERFAAAVPGCRIEWGASNQEQIIEPHAAPPANFGTVEKRWVFSDWKPLFDGRSLDGWAGDVSVLTIEDDVLVNDGKRGVVVAPGDYEQCEIELEFRLADKGNSGLGICYSGDGDPALNGLEVQLLDDGAYPQVTPDQKSGSLYKLAPSQAGHYKPWPEWNRVVVQTLGRDLSVTLNGAKAVATTRPLLQKAHPEHAGAQRTSGKICLFPHTARSEYRNFRVREATWTAVSAAAPPAAEAGTIDLLAAVDPARDAIAGEWQKENGALITPEEKGALNNARIKLPMPGPVPEAYDVELEVERLGDGGHGLVFGFVMRGYQAVIHMDSYGNPPLWGISDIDGVGGNKNETRSVGSRLPLGKRKTVRITIRRGRITVSCDGEKVVDWSQRPEQLSNGFWAVPDAQSLFLGSQSPFRVHAIRLTPMAP